MNKKFKKYAMIVMAFILLLSVPKWLILGGLGYLLYKVLKIKNK